MHLSFSSPVDDLCKQVDQTAGGQWACMTVFVCGSNQHSFHIRKWKFQSNMWVVRSDVNCTSMYLLKSMTRGSLGRRELGTWVPEGLMFHNRCLFFILIFVIFRHRISELHWPIAMKLCHVIYMWLNFIMQVQKFGGRPLKIQVPKTVQNWRRFYATSNFDREYLQNGTRYPKSERCDRERFLPCWWNKSGELCFTIQKVRHVSLDPPNSTFSGDYISDPMGSWPLKILHVLDIHQGLLAHTTNRIGGPPKIVRANIPHTRTYNFGGSGHNLTKFYQGMWLIAGVIKLTLILRGVPPTKFGRVKKYKIQRNFEQLSTLIANISGTYLHIENQKSTWSTTFHPLLGEKFCELLFTNQKVIGAHVDPPNWTFFGRLYFSPLGVLAPQIFYTPY